MRTRGQISGPGFFVAQAGQGPVHGGTASHSVHRMRRSSSPARIKTKGASSLPVFDPTNMAAAPSASRMRLLFAMRTSQWDRALDWIEGIWHLAAFLIQA